MEKQKSNWTMIIVILIILGFFSVLIAGAIGLFVSTSADTIVGTGNVALIDVQGVIMTTAPKFSESSVALSSSIIKYIEKAENDKSIKAIVMKIDSPGGSAVASDEIGEALKASKKPTVAWVREKGTSGAYWIASSTDHIIAHRASLTGSIGVIGSYLEFSGLMDEYGVGYERLIAGKYKDLASPYKKMNDEERAIFQEMLDELHTLFIEKVADNRKLSVDKVREIATGAFFTGAKGKELGLVDELGGKKEVEEYLKKTLEVEEVKFREYRKPKGLFDLFSGVSDEVSYFMGRGIGYSLVENKLSNDVDVRI